MNPVAANFTGWTTGKAEGRPLTQVLNIMNAKTGKKVINPASKVLKNGEIAGLANHTVLIAKDGKEYQIADLASPIRDSAGCF